MLVLHVETLDTLIMRRTPASAASFCYGSSESATGFAVLKDSMDRISMLRDLKKVR